MTSPNTLAVDDVRAAMALVRQRRIDLGMTQQQVGDLVGVNQNVVTSWETGSDFPTGLRMAKLLRAVGLRLSAVEARP